MRTTFFQPLWAVCNCSLKYVLNGYWQLLIIIVQRLDLPKMKEVARMTYGKFRKLPV